MKELSQHSPVMGESLAQLPGQEIIMFKLKEIKRNK